MGYNLTIGELEIEYDQEEEYCTITAKPFDRKDAPAFGEPTDFLSVRWPSYSAWASFCKFTDLTDLFFDAEQGILAHHPGCVPLSQRHKQVIDAAHITFRKKYPNAKAAYSPKINFRKGIFEDLEWPEENDWLCRLEWLKYWVDWTLAHCKQPVFANT